MTDRPATRLYLPGGLAEGAEVALGEDQAHKLRTVLRLGPGAVVAGFNARDGEFLCRIIDLRRGDGRLSVERRLRTPEAEPDLWLVFAPIKRARLDWLVEKAAELGAAALVPVWTERTQPERLNLDRLTAHAVAAAEQSGRLSVPVLHAPKNLARLVAEWPAERHLYVCDETGGGVPIATVAAGYPAALLIGPEGGFGETELDAIGKLSFATRVGLGPLVLRAETAAIAALAVFQAVAGDWRPVPSA
jgi:16S rRNA (uracil1498-N3)-methyltransferase